MLTVLHAGGKFGQAGAPQRHGWAPRARRWWPELPAGGESPQERHGARSLTQGLPQGAVEGGGRGRGAGSWGAPEGGFERSDTGTLVSFVPDHEIFSQGTKMEPQR